VAASDLDKLEALCKLGPNKLSPQEHEAFSEMHERMQRGTQRSLTSRQRQWVTSRYLHYELDADEPAENLVSSGKVPKTDLVLPYELLHRPKKPPGKEEPKEEPPLPKE
jgi:hypothetical protein